ncbi:MAG: SDR family oxidoreductase [Caulobacteraceae bacterium]|nr:SDR family oxidoreductase [Caulobacteraceae bacterium]
MASTLSLKGRAALITGASRNIGAATATAFAEAGADLLIVARGADALETKAEELRAATGRRVVTLAADLADADGIERLLETADREFEQIDVLVNNAFDTGDTFRRSILEIDWSDWTRCIGANLEAPFKLSQALARRMLEGRGGSIINVLSTAGFTPLPSFGPYGTTKAALWMLTRYMAKECAPKVRFNAVCPGTTAEDGGESRRDAWANVLPLVPLRRVGLPQETAQAMLFLASDASSYTTGQVLFVDGGRVSAAAG